MTDITELALRLKLEAHRAVSNFNPQMNIKTRDLKELVEALEKAQAGEKQWREVVDAFCADDADWHKLTNSNNELIALLSQALCKQADRIADLESRTVTVKLPERYACELGYNAPDPNGDMLDRDDVLAMLTAAGIKWEAE